MAGFFITFEGIDFCGKTTQARRLDFYLRRKGYNVILVREPGGDRIAERIRRILLSKKNSEMTAVTELLLYEAARSQLTQRVISPALKEGKVVVCDRYSDSSLAYQGYGRGLDKKMIKYLNSVFTFGLLPDLTILLDVPVKTSFKRRKKEKRDKDRLEKERFEFHQRIREGYLTIARQNRKRIKVIDGTENIDKTWQKVKKVVDSFLVKSSRSSDR
ncbi:MAG: dTMP kinase [candidate division Zixibacteria bacterium]|nr:dTMP kinase [candidate division Zixibacteria bacterium]